MPANPQRTGVVCPSCGQPFGVRENKALSHTMFWCPACNHRWVEEAGTDTRPPMKVLLWEARSNSAILARCVHEHASAEHGVTVTVGEVERIREAYRTEEDALEEAAHLLAHYRLDGWVVTYRDPRIALP